MSTKRLGRNDPCWCGSGKKYKKCHLRQDQEETRAARPAPPPAPRIEPGPGVQVPSPPFFGGVPEPSPEEAAAEEAWEQFTEADLDTKLTLFQERLDERRLDAEDAFEMLSEIRTETDFASVRARFAELVEHLRRELPDVYRHDQHYYLWYLVEDAASTQRWEALPQLLAGLADTADEHFEEFYQVIQILLYHGQTQALLEAMDAAWPRISESEEVLGWAIDEYGGTVMYLALYDYLDRTPAPRADDPALFEVLSRYGRPVEAWFARAVEHLAAPAPSAWRVDDFGEAVDAEQWADNVQALLVEFMADRHRQAGVPWSRGELARGKLWDVLYQQFAETPPARSERSRRRKSGRKRTLFVSASPLVPGHEVLDGALSAELNILDLQPHKAGALIELLPAYLHFLARLGLIHPAQMDEALAALKPLGRSVVDLLGRFSSDDGLVKAVRGAWADDALEDLRQGPALAGARERPAPEKPEPSTRSAPPQLFTFKVVYRRAPEAWFILAVRGDQTLDDLHYAILNAAGFDSDHLYAFYMSGRAWDGRTEYSLGPDARHTSRTPIQKLPIRLKQRFLYLYDYGDEHHFDVQLVDASDDVPRHRYPRLVERHGEMPPQYGFWDDEEDWDDEGDWEEDVLDGEQDEPAG